MNTQEFSDSFDTLLNSYASQAVFGEQAAKSEIVLDEYEKSVLLTQAQDIVLKSYFESRTNAQGEGFDDSTKRQVDFSSLIKVAELSQAEDQSKVFDDRGIIYNMPLRKYPIDNGGTITWEEKEGTTDVLFILNEKLLTTMGGIKKNYVVVPINFKEYDREMSKAYAQPLKKQAWRMFQNQEQGFDIQSEVIPRWNLTAKERITGYKIRYVRRAYPIVLTDLPDGMEIDGFTKEQECELNPILHPEILQKAVELAVTTRGGITTRQREEQRK